MKFAKTAAVLTTALCVFSVSAYAEENSAKKMGENAVNKVEKAWDDATLTTKVKSELAKDEGLKTLILNVDSNKGDVTVTGTVKTEAEKDAITRIAKEVEGVKSFKNEVVVQP